MSLKEQLMAEYEIEKERMREGFFQDVLRVEKWLLLFQGQNISITTKPWIKLMLAIDNDLKQLSEQETDAMLRLWDKAADYADGFVEFSIFKITLEGSEDKTTELSSDLKIMFGEQIFRDMILYFVEKGIWTDDYRHYQNLQN